MPHKILSPAVPGRPRTPPPSVGADSISARGPSRRRKVCGTMQASSPTEVCYNAWPQPSRPAQNIKFIRRGGIHPARERLRRRRPPVRAGPKTRTEQAPLSKGARAEIGGLPPGKMPPPGARRLGDCPPAKCRPRGACTAGDCPAPKCSPRGPRQNAHPFRQRHFAAKQSLRPRFARPPPFDKGG